jgi:hypothetical protein
MSWRRISSVIAIMAVVFAIAAISGSMATPESWKSEWPRTDFSRHSISYDEILSGGPPKDGIPSIDRPSFVPAANAAGLAPQEPLISIQIGGEARGYPLRILIWHEIVNDTVGGLPIAVTWCPLCNSAVVFDRRVDGRELTFGTTGKLRHSDLVMYDRQTESWWQQFLGEGIVGFYTGKRLKALPSRVESLARFRDRFPNGSVLTPPAASGRPYGKNPYFGYDTSALPVLYRGNYSGKIPPLSRVIVIGDDAWPLEDLMKRRRIEAGGLVLTWEPGQSSPLDAESIEAGREIGNVVVQRRLGTAMEDVVHDISFAFAFHAFRPQGRLHVD